MQTSAPAATTTSTASFTPTRIPTLSLQESQLASTQPAISSDVAGTTSVQTLGLVASDEHIDMTQGQVAGAVVGSLGMLPQASLLSCKFLT
jgi:hypothetical protein